MSDHPPNFRLLPTFTHQILDSDGIFLNPVSGLHYVLHLFDATETALQSAFLGTDQSLLVIKETVRQSNDRVSYLENKHVKLQSQVDLKTASDAEFSDWLLNRAEEDWLTVAGLPRLSGVNWQDAARRQVADTIKLVLHTNRANVPFEVMYVSNPFRYQPNRQNFYNVRMDSAHSSGRIREIFSGFFRRNRPVSRPPALKDVSIRNKITPDTKIRISILHQFGTIYQSATRGASYKVSGHDARPLLLTIPAHGSTDRQRTYTFMQAVTHLPATFSDDHLTRIFQVVSNQQQGKLQSLFVVINDDQRERCLELVKQKRAAGRGPVGSSSASVPHTGGATGGVSGNGSGMDLSGAGGSSSVSFSGAFSAPGSGAGLQSAQVSLGDLARPPPPPPTSSGLPSDGHSHTKATVDRARDGSADSHASRRSSGHQSRTKVRVEARDLSRDRDHDSDSDRGSSGHHSKTKVRDKGRDLSRDRDRSHDSDSDRSRGKNSKDAKRRRSPSSSSERDRKRKKKSKTRRRPPSSSSSSTSGSGTGSGSDTSRSVRKSRKSKKKSKKSTHKTRER